MERINFTVRLFNTDSLAADGSNIPRRSCEAYITSPDYKILINDKLGMGGLTHKDRRLTPELKGLVGIDDKVQINNNALFYITRLYFKNVGDPFLYADAETFDADLFSGDRRDNIINLVGLIKSGVRMPVSVVIQALWSKRGVAEKIIRIKGFDFTMNPSFKNAGDLQINDVFSETVEDNDIIATPEELKTFSNSKEYKDCQLLTKVYSTDGAVSINDDGSIIKDDNDNHDEQGFERLLQARDKRNFTYSEIVAMYGQTSPQVQVISPLQGKELTREDIKQADDALKARKKDDKDTLTPFYNDISNLVEDGSRDKLQQLFRSNRDKLQNIEVSVPKDDPMRNQNIEARMINFFRTLPKEDAQGLRFYSSLGTVQDRLRDAEQPRFTQINRLIQQNKQYIKGKKLIDDKLDKLKLMFVQDFSLLIKNVIPEIKKGRTLDSLYALGRYGKEVKESSITASNTYRKVLLSEQFLKFVPKGLYGEWVVDMQTFYNNLIRYVFGSELAQIKLNLIDFNK